MDGHGRWEVGRLLVVAWVLVWPGLAQVRHPLPVLWMMPVTRQPGQENLTAAVRPAVSLALEDLSRQAPPLGSYEVRLQLLDSQCDGATGLKALFDAMWAGPKYLMVFGGVCPSVTALIARSLPALNLVQLSFAVMSPGLDDRRRYPNLFSTAPSDRVVNQALVKLLQRYGWSRVGILTQEGPRLSEMKKDLMEQLMEADVQIAAAESLSEKPCENLKKLKDSDVRIIIGQFEEDSASEVFCCASRLELFGGRYQWIIASGPRGRRRGNQQTSGCTADGLLAAADGTIRLDFRPLSNRNTRGVSGRTPEEYEEVYLSRLVHGGSRPSRLHGFAYDGVWAAAKALSQVMEAVKHREKYNFHRNITVTEKEVEKMLLDTMKHIQFEGVTGPVLFRNGERMTWIELSQFQGPRDVVVGQFNSFTQQLRLLNHTVKFKGAGPAKDRSSVRLQPRRVGLLLYTVLSTFAAFTIIITLIVLCFNIRNRKHWLLRATSRPLDELLLLGILLSTSYIPLSGLDGALLAHWMLDLLCSIRLWILSVGHSVGFGVLFAKTWQVYSVFTKTGTKEKLPQQKSWLAPPCRLVGGIFLLDVFVLTSWQILDPLRRVVSEHSLEGDSELCSSTNMDLWIAVLYAYKGPLLGVGGFLAWSIRAGQDVHPASHSEHLVLSMGAVMVSSGLGVSGSLLTSHHPPLQFCLSSLIILSCNALILVCLFGPKLLYIRANSSELDQTSQVQCDAKEEETSSTGGEPLRGLNQQLRRRITQLDVEMETLTIQLHERSESDPPDSSRHHVSAEISSEDKAGGDRSQVSRLPESTHVAQIYCEDRDSEMETTRPEDINSPEHVRRRLSVQLPILHHGYLLAIGGVPASPSSLFGSLHDTTAHPAFSTQL